MATTSRLGRPSKGARGHLVSRPPVEVDMHVRATAARLGYESVSDYVAAVLAVHEGLDHLAPQPTRDRQQEVLDISA